MFPCCRKRSSIMTLVRTRSSSATLVLTWRVSSSSTAFLTEHGLSRGDNASVSAGKTDCDEVVAASPTSAPPGKVCLPPDVPEDMTLQPSRDEYRMGDSVGLNCNQSGLFPQPLSFFTCGPSLTWDPPLPADLRCSNGTAAAPTLVFGESVSVDQQQPSVFCCRRTLRP